jgi:hypothetical protein
MHVVSFVKQFSQFFLIARLQVKFNEKKLEKIILQFKIIYKTIYQLKTIYFTIEKLLKEKFLTTRFCIRNEVLSLDFLNKNFEFEIKEITK